MGQSTINGPFSIAMLVYQRVATYLGCTSHTSEPVGPVAQFAARMVDSARAVLNDFLPDVWVYTDHCKALWDMDLPWPGEFF